MLENVIPKNLQKERKCPLSTPPDYAPPYPSYCARFPIGMKDLAMAVIGAQYASLPTNVKADTSVLENFITTAPAATRPSFWEIASVTDKRNALNVAILAYWPSVEKQKSWATRSGFNSWWNSPDREHDGHGWFQEILCPTVDRFETVFSNNENPEGAANMQEKISGEMEQHGYWGSMRDRLAAAQDNQLHGEKGICGTEQAGVSEVPLKRVRVPGKKNLCVIRSGQDWSDTLREERKLYLETMHSVLIEGMDFLRDHGRDLGCYAMNLWDVVDTRSLAAHRERTFGLGYFDDMASLERWSKSHQTHINIFGGFLRYAKKLYNVLSLGLFHEIYILEEGQQFFEYIGCHKASGMLGSL